MIDVGSALIMGIIGGLIANFFRNRQVRKAVLAECAGMCKEMALRYDFDIEGCSGEELGRYCEGGACARQLAKIIENDEMHKWMGGKEVK